MIKKEKICSKCKILKLADDFRIRKVKDRRYLMSDCKNCEALRTKNYRIKNPHVAIRHNKEYSSIRYFGITLEEYKKLSDKQGNVCAVCSGVNKNTRLCIDHCHETKYIRGLLCSNCNRALGLLGDKKEFVLRLLNYLNKYKKELKINPRGKDRR